MAIVELVQLIVPPSVPLHADANALASFMARFATSVPRDYVQLGQFYGTGSFGDASFYFHIENPLRPNYSEILDGECGIWRELREAFPAEYEYDIFPARPGYFPCGGDVDGGLIGWLAEGDPDEWPIVTKSRDAAKFEVYPMCLTTFLAKALTRELRPEVWRSDFPECLAEVTFVSGEQYHQR